MSQSFTAGSGHARGRHDAMAAYLERLEFEEANAMGLPNTSGQHEDGESSDGIDWANTKKKRKGTIEKLQQMADLEEQSRKDEKERNRKEKQATKWERRVTREAGKEARRAQQEKYRAEKAARKSSNAAHQTKRQKSGKAARKAKFTLQEKEKQQKNLEKEERERAFLKVWEESPTLFHLLGAGFQEHTSKRLIEQVISRIQKYKVVNPDIILQGGTSDLFRINYDPKAKDVTSISYASIDALLAPLLLTHVKFFHVPGKTRRVLDGHKLDDRAYRSQWLFNQRLLKFLQPITLADRHVVRASVLRAVRQRCVRVHPTSNLLVDPHGILTSEDEGEIERVYTWSLYGVEVGRAVKLKECFRGDERTPKEYEDRIEQVLYSFKRANQAEVYGGVSSAYGRVNGGECGRKDHVDSGIGEENNVLRKYPNTRSRVKEAQSVRAEEVEGAEEVRPTEEAARVPVVENWDDVEVENGNREEKGEEWLIDFSGDE